MQWIYKLGGLQADALQRKKAMGEKCAHMQTLLAELEHTMEHQARCWELDQDQLSPLEASLAQQQGDLHKRIAKLLSAYAAEKRRADFAEAIQGKLQDRLANEEALRHTQEHKAL